MSSESVAALGTVVHIHPDAKAYEVEFITLTGQTVAVATILPNQLRPVSRPFEKVRRGQRF